MQGRSKCSLFWDLLYFACWNTSLARLIVYLNFIDFITINVELVIKILYERPTQSVDDFEVNINETNKKHNMYLYLFILRHPKASEDSRFHLCVI